MSHFGRLTQIDKPIEVSTQSSCMLSSCWCGDINRLKCFPFQCSIKIFYRKQRGGEQRSKDRAQKYTSLVYKTAMPNRNQPSISDQSQQIKTTKANSITFLNFVALTFIWLFSILKLGISCISWMSDKIYRFLFSFFCFAKFANIKKYSFFFNSFSISFL